MNINHRELLTSAANGDENEITILQTAIDDSTDQGKKLRKWYTDLKIKLHHSRRAITSSNAYLTSFELFMCIRIAIEESDFKFALFLLISHITKYNLKVQDFNYKHLLLKLLSYSEIINVNHTNIFFLLLKTNGTNFSVFKTNYENKTKLKISLNPTLVKLAMHIDSKLYSAMKTFLNPFQKTLHANLPLEIRLLLAKIYLKNELEGYIQDIPDLCLEKILLSRSADYFYYFYRYIISHNITNKFMKNFPKKDSSVTKFKTTLEESITKYLMFFTHISNRQKLVNHLQSIRYDLIVTNLGNFYINIIIAWLQSCRNEVNDNLIDELSDFFLLYAVEQAHNFLAIPNIKKITDDYVNLSKIETYLFRNTNKNLKYFSLADESKKWLRNHLLMLSLNLGNHSIINLLDTYQYSNESLLIYAVSINNHKILERLLNKNINIPCSDFKKFFNQANHKTIILLFRILEQNIHILTAANQEKTISFFTDLACRILGLRRSIYLEQLIKLTKPLQVSLIQHIANILYNLFPHHIVNYYYISHRNVLLTPRSNNLILRHVSNVQNQTIMMRFLQSHIWQLKHLKELPTSATLLNSLKLICQKNYQKLIDDLRNPHIISDEINTLMKSRGFNPFLGKENLLTPRETDLYRTLINMKWKLMHRVKNVTDMEKILQDGELRSILNRQLAGECPKNQTTPSEHCLDGYIFLTIGPENAPTPFFLRNSGGFEFDVDQLLTKFPHFFKHIYLSSHWHAFTQNQEFSPISIMGTIIKTKHNNIMQTTSYFYRDGELPTITVSKRLSENLYIANPIHILSFLFIYQLRLMDDNTYNSILANADNKIFISTLFTSILHPGLYELRYPDSIPINDEYCKTIPFKLNKTLSNHELDLALNNISFLKNCIQNGFDVEQSFLFEVNLEGKTHSYLGNFLTKSILEKKNDIIDFLLQEDKCALYVDNKGILSPLAAAIQTNNSPLVIRLLSKGWNINGLKNCHRLSNYTNDVIPFLQRLSLDEITKLAAECELVVLNQLLYICCQRLLQEKDQTNILDAIFILLQYGADSSYIQVDKFGFSTAMTYALLAHADQLVISLLIFDSSFKGYITQNDTRYSFVEYLIATGRSNLLERIINDGYVENWGHTDILILYLSGMTDLFSSAMCSYFDFMEDTATKSDLIYFITDQLYMSGGDTIYDLQLRYNSFSKPQWGSTKHINYVLKAICDYRRYSQYITKLSDLMLINIFFDTTDIRTLANKIEFICENKFIYKEKLIVDMFDSIPERVDQTQIINLLVYLKQYPEWYLHACLTISEIKIRNLFDTHFLFQQLDQFHHNYFLTQSLLELLSTPEAVSQIIIFLPKEHKAPSKLFQWLYASVNNHRALCNLLLPTNQEHLKSLIDSFQDILYKYATCNLSHKTESECLLIFLHKLNSNIKLPSANHFNTFWQQKYFNEDYPLQSDLKPEEKSWSYYLAMPLDKLKLRPEIPTRHAAVGFISCVINNKPHIYLGQKLYNQTKIPELLAPGGYIDLKKESVLAGLQRELSEETIYPFYLPSPSSIINNLLMKHGQIHFADDSYSSIHQPSKISMVYKYHSYDAFNHSRTLTERIIYFFSIEYKHDISHFLKFGDDFTNGIWVPIDAIISPTTKPSYDHLPILYSNALLIKLINSMNVSYDFLDQTIFAEIYQRFSHRNALINNTFLNTTKNNKRVAPTPGDEATKKIKLI